MAITSFPKSLYMLLFKIEDPFCGLKGYDLSLINEDSDYLIKTMEDVNTYLMMAIVKKNLNFCNYKIKVGKRPPNLSSRFGKSLSGEIKLLKSIKYWI